MEKLGSSSLFTSSYRPESNGIIERFHRTLKNSLDSILNLEGDSWKETLPFVTLGLRSTIPAIPGSTFSSMHYVLGSAPRLPLSLNKRASAPNNKKLFQSSNEIKYAQP
ncbi:unnamed protein product [Lepeophtheirus salmonis]|uniref:(salmon louse) hypothetical protein n=1 Tax=Lepeophtheirus salmonis TaxID=72036 RepID=A0A7R8CND5_LEPSM|nr:unnamed protein product [Lepeophtheirus salmonis]CAF2874391.1 unnamed protein product [Lepeophtheirus salmonis]